MFAKCVDDPQVLELFYKNKNSKTNDSNQSQKQRKKLKKTATTIMKKERINIM